jgi:hypothetical protein
MRLCLSDVVLEATGQLVRGRESAVPPSRYGDEHNQPPICPEQSQLSRWRSRALQHDPGDPLTLGLISRSGFVSRGQRALERLEMRMDILHTRFST